MTYGLSNQLFLENGPAVQAARAAAHSSARAFRAWRGLDADGRLALVEQALAGPANDDHSDDFSVAL